MPGLASYKNSSPLMLQASLHVVRCVHMLSS
jgi:hypothetical protein